MVSLGTLPRGRYARTANGSSAASSAPPPPLSEDEARKTCFRDAVRDAEKSTLVFNLDMGRVPIMNHKTMSLKATGSLVSMAAAVEGNNPSAPSEDAVAAINDLLSITKNISFFGSTTKSYINPSDPASASYCTIPVKYEFKDRDSRIRAENTLRKLCKVKCTTPYPPILRECIKKAVESGKAARPESFVRVNVDTTNLCLCLAWRAKDESGWVNHPDPIPLPMVALEVKSRKVPDNMVLENLPLPNDSCMEVPTSPVITEQVRPTTRSHTRSPLGKNTPRK